MCLYHAFEDDLHNLVNVPQYGIGVEVLCWIKPQVYPFFPVVKPVCINVGLKNTRLPTHIPQELNVDLVPIRLIRTQLHCHSIMRKLR